MVIHKFCQSKASEPVDTQRLTSSSTPLSSRDGESDYMQRYLIVIRTFCQPEASEPVDTQRLTSSSPLSSRDVESDDMWRYPSGYPYKRFLLILAREVRWQAEILEWLSAQRRFMLILTREVRWQAKIPYGYPHLLSIRGKRAR